jgi:hypothetical protein
LQLEIDANAIASIATITPGISHDELHTRLDYIDEVARILVDAALNYNSAAPLSETQAQTDPPCRHEA